ncbi:unnamed protein product, partial [Rotaria magnacalcarata]
VNPFNNDEEKVANILPNFITLSTNNCSACTSFNSA